MTFGPKNLLDIGKWVYVYGLMVYLPACAASSRRPVLRRPPRPIWPVAVALPLVFIFPLAAWLVAMGAWKLWRLIRPRPTR
jgi:hypothetical protein